MSLPPGWYKDPADREVQRWWDGEGWVGDPLPADTTPPPGPPPREPAGSGMRPEPQVPAVPGMPGIADFPPGPGIRPGLEVPPSPEIRPEIRPGPEIPPSPPARRPPDPATTPPPARSHHRGPQHPIAAPAAPPRPHGHTLATPGARLLARLVDLALLFGLNVLVNGWFVYRLWEEMAPTFTEAWRRAAAGDTSTDGIPPIGERFPDLLLTILAIAAALWFAYEVPSVANTGQTLGKRLLKIKVVRLESSEPISFGRSFRRWNTMGFPTLLWYCFGVGLLLQLLDALYVLFDRPLHQALHDKSAHTAVINVATDTGPPPNSHEEG